MIIDRIVLYFCFGAIIVGAIQLVGYIPQQETPYTFFDALGAIFSYFMFTILAYRIGRHDGNQQKVEK